MSHCVFALFFAFPFLKAVSFCIAMQVLIQPRKKFNPDVYFSHPLCSEAARCSINVISFSLFFFFFLALFCSSIPAVDFVQEFVLVTKLQSYRALYVIHVIQASKR